jgi:hypothetical protein
METGFCLVPRLTGSDAFARLFTSNFGILSSNLKKYSSSSSCEALLRWWVLACSTITFHYKIFSCEAVQRLVGLGLLNNYIPSEKLLL